MTITSIMQRELGSFPLPPVYRLKLQNAGFITVEDLTDVKPSELSKELALTKEEALDILKLVRGGGEDGTINKSGNQTVSVRKKPHHEIISRESITALDMLQDEDSQRNIITFSEQLDGLLGGGVPLTKVTEFCGAPGVGKTQMCLQLCVDVQIPDFLDGLAGEAIYIDTEGSFLVERLADIAKATVKHCHHIANPEDKERCTKELTLQSLLSGIHYFRCYDYVELLATVHLLPEFLQEHPKVKLIVVDSIAFHFRHDFEDLSLRTRLLNGLAQSFIKMATLNKLAVVLTNQMTTKVQLDQPNASHLVPALGESWGHASTIRVILYWQNSVRYALLYKSPSRQEATVPYQITTGGVRDVQHHHSASDPPPSKRQRTDT